MVLVKPILKNFLNTIILLLKATTFALLLFSFFYMFSLLPKMDHLLEINRTTAVTVLTFIIVGTLMLKTYGSYDIGKKKSKPIIYSLAIATFLTDLITFLMLSVMNTNAKFNPVFKLTGWLMLIPILIIQVCVLFVMVYLGNYIYFQICVPRKVLIIVDTHDDEAHKHIVSALKQTKKQYSISKIVDYHDLKDQDILDNDTIYIGDIPLRTRETIIEFCYKNLRHMLMRPSLADIVEVSSEQVILDDMLTISADVKFLSLEQRFVKRAMDIVIALLGILFSSPIWIIASIFIKKEDGGPVFYKQPRLTRDGQVFNVLKFRTMKVNSENYPAQENDDRITKIGHILRRIRMDELPQLFNILSGDMSVVGPRPEMVESYEVYKKEFPMFYYRLRVKGGLTGYAQIAGKYNTSREDKLALDLLYIEKYSIWLDFKLILQTVTVFFKKDSTEGFNHKTDDE